MSRYTYAHGYKSREAAYDGRDDLMSYGDISFAEAPEIEPYKALRKSDGKRVTRYKITLSDGV